MTHNDGHGDENDNDKACDHDVRKYLYSTRPHGRDRKTESQL